MQGDTCIMTNGYTVLYILYLRYTVHRHTVYHSRVRNTVCIIPYLFYTLIITGICTMHLHNYIGIYRPIPQSPIQLPNLTLI